MRSSQVNGKSSSVSSTGGFLCVWETTTLHGHKSGRVRSFRFPILVWNGCIPVLSETMSPLGDNHK